MVGLEVRRISRVFKLSIKVLIIRQKKKRLKIKLKKLAL